MINKLIAQMIGIRLAQKPPGGTSVLLRMVWKFIFSLRGNAGAFLQTKFLAVLSNEMT
jgi:hypothetical protein